MSDDLERRATDAGNLRRDDAYGRPDGLDARASIYRYLERRHEIVPSVLGLIDIPADGRVLDVGCGPGQYLRHLATTRPDLRLVGLDLSMGMAATAHAAGLFIVNGDVQALPFSPSRFDVVLAPHMLYHVPDLTRAVSELRRVLHDDGVALVTTNSGEHLRQKLDLLADAVGAASGAHPGRVETFTRRFALENAAEVLSTAFDVDGPHRWRNRLVVPEPEPVLAYLDSMRAVYEGLLPEGVGWEAVVEAARPMVEATIERDGAWISTTESGAFVCRSLSS